MQLIFYKIFSMGQEKKKENKAPHTTHERQSHKQQARKQDTAVMVPEAQHAAWYQLLRAHSKVTQRIDQRLLQAQQIAPHWYDVLVTLEKAPGHRLRMSELADNLVTSRSNLTRLVDRLENEGLLRRELCPNDRRGSYAVLTKAGARARLAAWPVISRAIVELFADHVNDEEAHFLSQVLRRVADRAADSDLTKS